MNTTKKSVGKRKRPSPSPSTTSQIGRRLEKLRSRQRNLWNDDNDIDETEQHLSSKSKDKTVTDNTYIVLTDSDDEKTSARKRSRSHKTKKKSSQISDENFSSDNDHKIGSKCPTCLICSILSTLTSYNCCSKHLATLIHNQQPPKQITNTDPWPPQQVMILPMTDELIQRYLNPQETYRRRTRTSLSPGQKKTTESKRSVGIKTASSKISFNSYSRDENHQKRQQTHPNHPIRNTRMLPDVNYQIGKFVCPLETIFHIDPRSTQMETEHVSSSSSTVDSSLPDSQTNPPDVTYTVITSTSTTINSFESPNVLDTCQLQQSSDQPIVIDDSQTENIPSNRTNEKKQNDPWTPISDETCTAIETALEQVNQHSQEEMEFTPAIARRTPTELMASRLPKIQLKKGRYYRGKPVTDANPLEKTTTITNESLSTTISQSSTSSITISATTTKYVESSLFHTPSFDVLHSRPAPALATIIEDESLIIQPTHPNSEKTTQSCHVSSDRHDHTTECLSDTVMNGLFAQDESSQQDVIHSTTKSTSNDGIELISFHSHDRRIFSLQ